MDINTHEVVSLRNNALEKGIYPSIFPIDWVNNRADSTL